MGDYFEIDFLDVEAKKSGDAIAIRYEIDGQTRIHVVDGGYRETGDKVVQHIKSHYANPTYINHIVLTHQDGDHAGGLEKVLNEFDVGALWMLRPWTYAAELLTRFSRYSNVDNLAARLKEIYPNIAKLEDLANEKGIPIYEPFQASQIGAFTVLAPSKSRYLDLVVESDKTPDAAMDSADLGQLLKALLAKAVSIVKSAWGAETFSSNETSAENNMSVVQFAVLCDERILLTGDVGRSGLNEAADFLEANGVPLPGINRFQVPHHGSRRNVDSSTLDRWLGPKLASQPLNGNGAFTAIISSAKEDEDHPRKAVVRACIHRGAKVFATEGTSICSFGGAAPYRGWAALTPASYPEEQEEE